MIFDIANFYKNSKKYKKANIDKTRIGAPKIEGIKEVADVLSLKKVTPKPHVIRKIPYITEIPSIFNPRKVNSTLFI